MASREFSWQLGWECSGFSAIIKAAKLGLGIAVLSESLISEEVQNGELNKLVFAGSSLRRSYSLVSHKNKFITPSLEAFMDVCKAVLAKS
ncbi:MAG TPA: hypothetical protein IAB06_06395 [Candidatus Avacidaminococcus intestinavium]|uniref:LysR substrate-binding domain-containing protein n=1 Tax=Candidatus Avacidaminococcus intestinavium TaxID=2840684 RepID=A0A9D1MQA1_9FIRM|nr:hypothetical protein [Candidatus Avacidaminococcus intestinavium]